MNEPPLNSTATAELTVAGSDLASASPDSPPPVFPAVLATARMVALMEVASARIVQPFLVAGETSVGVNLQVTHTAATAPGAKVRAEARYLGREGKLFLFEVAAYDPAGEIGRARHTRAVVTTARLEAGAARRRGA